MEVREYGSSARTVVLIHGGPGAPGYLAPLAASLADAFHVLEPFQRRSGGAPLTLARHVEDLQEVVSGLGGARPILVGHSWGAMLALAHAAKHPAASRALVLIGCGTFDRAARQRLNEVRDQRMSPSQRRRLANWSGAVDPDGELRAVGDAMLAVDSCDPVVTELDAVWCDARGAQESWDDLVRLLEGGVYPRACAAITAPVLMLHGAVDPHPGPLIRAGLEPYLPQLEYREWPECGHYPWLERGVRDEFLVTLREWLSRQFAVTA
jgi:pimeloyl-ACP methyl ester carboxylesterase